MSVYIPYRRRLRNAPAPTSGQSADLAESTTRRLRGDDGQHNPAVPDLAPVGFCLHDAMAEVRRRLGEQIGDTGHKLCDEMLNHIMHNAVHAGSFVPQMRIKWPNDGAPLDKESEAKLACASKDEALRLRELHSGMTLPDAEPSDADEPDVCAICLDSVNVLAANDRCKTLDMSSTPRALTRGLRRS